MFNLIVGAQVLRRHLYEEKPKVVWLWLVGKEWRKLAKWTTVSDQDKWSKAIENANEETALTLTPDIEQWLRTLSLAYAD